jgi:hypothetical protein
MKPSIFEELGDLSLVIRGFLWSLDVNNEDLGEKKMYSISLYCRIKLLSAFGTEIRTPITYPEE